MKRFGGGLSSTGLPFTLHRCEIEKVTFDETRRNEKGLKTQPIAQQGGVKRDSTVILEKDTTTGHLGSSPRGREGSIYHGFQQPPGSSSPPFAARSAPRECRQYAPSARKV